MQFINDPKHDVDYAEDKQDLIELVREVGFRVPAWLDRAKSWVNDSNNSRWNTFRRELWEDIREGGFSCQVEFKNFGGRCPRTRVEYILEGSDWQLQSYWSGEGVGHFTLTAVEDYRKTTA